MRLCGLRSLLWILPVDLGLALNTTPKRVWASFPNNPRWVHSESGAPGWLLLVFVVQFSLRKTEQNPDEESRLCSCFSPPARGQSPPIVASSTVRRAPRWPAGFPVLVGACQFGTAWSGLRLNSFIQARAPPVSVVFAMKRARARALRTPRACGEFPGPKMWPWSWPWFTTEML